MEFHLVNAWRFLGKGLVHHVRGWAPILSHLQTNWLELSDDAFATKIPSRDDRSLGGSPSEIILSYFHHSLMKVTFLAIRRYPANISSFLKDDKIRCGTFLFPELFFVVCNFWRGWDFHIFPPDKVPAPPKKWRLFHFQKRMAKTQESGPWVHFLMLSFWPWFPGPWNWRIRTRVGCYEKCHAHVEMRQGVWDCLRWRDVATAEPPAKKVTWHVRFLWVLILWLRMQGKCHW